MICRLICTRGGILRGLLRLAWNLWSLDAGLSHGICTDLYGVADACTCTGYKVGTETPLPQCRFPSRPVDEVPSSFLIASLLLTSPVVCFCFLPLLFSHFNNPSVCCSSIPKHRFLTRLLSGFILCKVGTQVQSLIHHPPGPQFLWLFSPKLLPQLQVAETNICQAERGASFVLHRPVLLT